MPSSEHCSFVGALVAASRAHPRVTTIVIAYLVVFVLAPCGIGTWLNVSKPPYASWAVPLLFTIPWLPLIVGDRIWTYLKRRRGRNMAKAHADQRIDDQSF